MMMRKYAAKLLFQFRVVQDGTEPKMRMCEESIIHVEARTSKFALAKVKRIGKKREYSYDNSSAGKVYFEFIGVRDFLELGDFCEPNEVWYDIKTYRQPMERKNRFIPQEEELLRSIS